MIVTERVNSPFLDSSNIQDGLGYVKDSETGDLYFYVSYRVEMKWQIYRFNVNCTPLKLEYMGKVDFKMVNVTVSVCGYYFWSIEIDPELQIMGRQRLRFRQVNIKTLQSVEFQTPDLDPRLVDDMSNVEFCHTCQGTFISIFSTRSNEEEGRFEHVDHIFRLNINEKQRSIQTEHIYLPDLATISFYRNSAAEDSSYYRKYRTGILEINNSIFFYRIDYFGDLYVLEWRTDQKWNQFLINDGDYRPKSFIESNNRNFQELWETSNWCNIINCLRNSHRVYFSNNVLEKKDPETESTFYRLDLRPELRTCKCTQLFRTNIQPSYNHYVFWSSDISKNLFIINGKKRCRPPVYTWEVVRLNELPKLQNIAYWTIRRHMRKDETNLLNRLKDYSRQVATKFSKKGIPEPDKEGKDDPNFPAPNNSFLFMESQTTIIQIDRQSISYLLHKLMKNKKSRHFLK